jgi:GMP synthase-like glutamine amidotransferase
MSSLLKSKKILMVNDHAPSYFRPFMHLGLECTRVHGLLEHDPDSIALVVFTGGSDVTPDLYGKDKHPRTYNSEDRDMEETELFGIAEAAGIPMAGICRGAQFLCVMAGGSLVQDITDHAGGNHSVMARWPGEPGPRQISVNSSHHQMQYPYDLPEDTYEVLARSVEPLSRHYALDDKVNISVADAGALLKSEPDVVMYHSIKALGAQYHPEWMREDTEGFLYFKALVDYHLLPLMEKRYRDDRKREETSKATS